MFDHPAKTRPDLVLQPDTSSPAARSVGKRLLRKHHVLNVIREHGPLSRGEIAHLSGFNLPSVSSFVDELIQENLVNEGEIRKTPLGRHPLLVSLNETAASVLGIDVGHERTRAVYLDLGGNVLAEIEEDTPADETADARGERLVHLAERLLERSSVQPRPPLTGIGVGMPGLVENDKKAHSAGSDVPAARIRLALGPRFRVPIFVDNDARTTALGAVWFGQARGYENFILVKVGHQLGLGIFLEGKPYKGAWGYAGELGSLSMGQEGIAWGTRPEAALDNVASGAGLVRLAKVAGLEVREARDLADLARNGNAQARAVFGRFATALGRGIAGAVNLLNPEAVILSGSVTHASDLFLADFKRELERYTMPQLVTDLDLLVSDNKEKDGTMGAAANVLQRIFSPSHIKVQEVL